MNKAVNFIIKSFSAFIVFIITFCIFIIFLAILGIIILFIFLTLKDNFSGFSDLDWTRIPKATFGVITYYGIRVVGLAFIALLIFFYYALYRRIKKYLPFAWGDDLTKLNKIVKDKKNKADQLEKELASKRKIRKEFFIRYMPECKKIEEDIDQVIFNQGSNENNIQFYFGDDNLSIQLNDIYKGSVSLVSIDDQNLSKGFEFLAEFNHKKIQSNKFEEVKDFLIEKIGEKIKV